MYTEENSCTSCTCGAKAKRVIMEQNYLMEMDMQPHKLPQWSSLHFIFLSRSSNIWNSYIHYLTFIFPRYTTNKSYEQHLVGFLAQWSECYTGISGIRASSNPDKPDFFQVFFSKRVSCNFTCNGLLYIYHFIPSSSKKNFIISCNTLMLFVASN